MLVTALSLPGATVMTLAGGAVFGLGWGTLLISFVVFAVLTVVSFRGPTGEMKVTPPKTKFKTAKGDDTPGLLIGQDYTK